MYEIPQKVKNLLPYETNTNNCKIRLDANESFVRLSDEEISEAIRNIKINRYPDPYAYGVLKAFGKFYGVSSENVTAGNGSDELISLITSCLLNKGDKILIFSPDFTMYGFYPTLYELDLIVMEKNHDLKIDISEAINKINSENIKAVIFSNPCNPTSVGLDGVSIKRLANETNALVILDEAYMDFWDERESLLKVAHEYQNLIVLRTCSKAMALAGIRLGFAVSNTAITTCLRTVKSPYNVNSLSQAIGEKVLSGKQEIDLMILNIKSMTKCLKKHIISLNIKEFIKVFDTATNFIFIETENESIANEIFKFLLDKSILIRKMGKYLRITCGNPSENEILIKQLIKYSKEYS